MSRRLSLFLLLAALITAIAIYQILAVRGTFAPSRPLSQATGLAIECGAPSHRLAGRMYLSGPANPNMPLVVVLHGDAPGINPSYQYLFASQVAAAAPGARVAALLRPGYADPFGAKSDGDRGLFSAGENYTPEVTRDLSDALRDLKTRWNVSTVILVGHSGGATLTANISALNPGLVQHAFLISCPCDVPAFRLHMAHLQLSPVWLLPVRSLSPIATLNQMPPGVSISAISGADDPIALPQYAEAYIQKARAQGNAASITILPNQGHEILLDPAVINAVAQAANNHN